jgi:hypothetical protein
MKCYNHNKIDAVATCRKCGKHLCKECYDKGQKGICHECLVTMHKETVVQNKEYHYSYIKKSLIAVVVGAVIGLSFAIGMNATNKLQGNIIDTSLRLLNYITQPIILGFVALSFYWGLSFFSKVMKKIMSRRIILIFTWPALVVVFFTAVFAGVFAGIPMFIYHLVKFVGCSSNGESVQNV